MSKEIRKYIETDVCFVRFDTIENIYRNNIVDKFAKIYYKGG